MRIFIFGKYHIAGGTEKMICAFANGLSEQHDVHLALRVLPDFSAQSITLHPQVKLLTLFEPPFPDWSKWKNLLRVDWKYLWFIRNYILKNKINVIYAHDISVSQAALLKLLTRKPLVWHNHNGEMVSFTDEKRSKYRKYTFNTNSIISINTQLTAYCRKYFPNKNRGYYTVPNFVSTDTCAPVTDLPEGFNIVYIGNIRKVKNQLLLIKAFEQFKINHPEANLILVGQGVDPDYEKELNITIANSTFVSSIYLLGSRKDIQHILQQSQIGVLTSTYEGFGLVLLEYGLAQLPIVCSNIEICNNILENGQFGYLFENNNAASLTKELSNVYNNYEEAKQKADQFKTVIESKYCQSTIIDTISTILQDAIKG